MSPYYSSKVHSEHSAYTVVAEETAPSDRKHEPGKSHRLERARTPIQAPGEASMYARAYIMQAAGEVIVEV